MDEQKKKLTDKLYFIRAMLSKISQADEKNIYLEDQKKKIKNEKFETNYRESSMLDGKSQEEFLLDIENAESKIAPLYSLIDAANKELERVEKLINDPTARKSDQKTHIIVNMIFIPITLVIGFFLCKWWLNTNYSFWVGLLFFPISLFLLLIDISLITTTSLKTTKLEERRNSVLNQLTKFESELKKEFPVLSNMKKKYEKYIDFIKNKQYYLELEHKRFLRTQKKQIELIEEKQLAHIKATAPLYELALKASNNIIDERDWKHLDIIIYELETGRAETIKEALQQTDLLIRHNEIKQEINKAAAAICISIERNMSEINYSIERNMARIHDNFVSLGEDQRRMQESLNNLVSAQELSNALKEKANVSSAQLAEDVRRLRELKDYEYYGHTN